MTRLRFGTLIVSLLLSQCALAQLVKSVDWTMLADPEAKHFEDPYRELSSDQFRALMALAQLKADLANASKKEVRAELNERISALSRGLEAQGLDPDWILAQRETVAERRRHAALATNAELEGEDVELSGYLLVASEVDGGARVAYLLPDRGVCMHLPPAAPNQLVRLAIEHLPEPLAPCIGASVRGRLATRETRTKVPVFDKVVMFWSRWQLDVSEAITAGPPQEDDDRS